MASIQGKAHISIDGYLFMLGRQIRTERHIYGREEAPNFVNKFSSGDPNYRDSTFFPHWVQNNWLNGFEQEKFNDGGKYYRSSSVDPTVQEKLTLEKLYSSTGLTSAGIKILCQKAWRAAATSAFGNGSDGALTISSNTTDAPIDSACTGTQGSNALSATNASFVAGQVILIHQSQGTGAGTWQKNKILSYTAGTITLETALAATYTTGAQVIVMKQYTTITVNSGITWTAKVWNGTVGGILAVLANSTVTVTGIISANGVGFRGGEGFEGDGDGQQGESILGIGTNSRSANSQGGGGGDGDSGNRSPGGGGGGHAVAGTDGQGSNGNLGGIGGGTGGTANLITMIFGGGGGGGARASGQSGNAGNGGAGGGIIFLFVKTPTVTGAISTNGAVGGEGTVDGGSGGGGAGGAILIKGQTIVLGTTLVTSIAGAGGVSGADGGAGGAGRIHIDYLTSVSGTTNPTLNSTQDSTLSDSPASGTFTHMVGGSDGKIYEWNGASTWTEVFDTRKLTQYDTVADGDTDKIVGDTAGTETAQAQSFQVASTMKMKAIRVRLKKNAGTPGNITVRIETNSGGNLPSGTLLDATNATATISAFVTTSYGWITVEFPAAFQLTASTKYWLVLKTAAAANDQNYAWHGDASSPTYASQNMAASTDGGSTWVDVPGTDALFQILGSSTTVNCSLITDVGGTQKIYFGIGDPEGTNNGDARVISYDGTTWAIAKVFNTSNESSVLSMAEFGSTTPTIYFGLGHKAKIYKTTDFSTFTLSKTITVPSNPGYVFAMTEYNGRLYAGGGYPEQLNNTSNQFFGFLYSFDEFQWQRVGEFEHTVVKSLDTYDNLLFIGTIKRRFYVYNTASVDKLMEFPFDVQMTSMIKWEDKLAIALAPTPGSAQSGQEGIYLFDRNGFHNAFNATSKEWWSLGVHNNNIMGGSGDGFVYRTNATSYQASGTVQSSYFEASLPSIDKKWRSLILQYESLPTGCSILAEYKTDESDASWTNLGTANTVASVTAEFTFSDTFFSKKLSIRLTLATSVSGSTPTLKLQDIKYVLYPDFKYLWKMTLACPDNLVWLDGTEPISTTTAASISANATSLVLADASGFPTKGRAVLVDGSTQDEFTWTGKSSNTLTGIPSSGSLALSAHSSTGYTVKMTGKTMHATILALKQAKSLYTFVDIDEGSYLALFHGYQEDNFVVNQEGGLENHVPITLLQV